MKLRAKLPDATPPSKPAALARDPSVSHAARNLALAYRLDQLIQQGLLADYGAAAKLLGVSQPRLTHLMSLTMLAPQIQEAILAGTIAPADKALRRIARVADWREQLAMVAG
jgi:predicted XRE-type DNA-binding protein